MKILPLQYFGFLFGYIVTWSNTSESTFDPRSDNTALTGPGYKWTCLHLDFYFHSKWFDARLNHIGGTQAVNWRPTPINFNTLMTPAQVHISEPSYQAHCLFFSLALKALLLILWPNYTSSLWLTKPITQKCYSTKQYGAATRFGAMQLSAEITVGEEINEIERFFYMQSIKIRFSKQNHVMLFLEVFSMAYSMHTKSLHSQADRHLQLWMEEYWLAILYR